MSTTYRATDLVSSNSSLYDHAIVFKPVVSSQPATQAARFWSYGVYQARPAVTMNAPEAPLPSIGALGWTATDALETRSGYPALQKTGKRQAWKPTMTCKRGDVILVRFPNSDLKTYKKRPALVVQANDLSTGLPQKIIALITSNLRRTGDTRVQFPQQSQAARCMGLRTDSVVVTDNLATVLEREIDKTIGHCPEMPAIDQALKQTLGLM